MGVPMTMQTFAITLAAVVLGSRLSACSTLIYYILGWNKIKAELETGRKKPLPACFGFLGKYIYVPITAVVFVLGILYGGIG
jgi:neurotransmitter:Na+ symporter, NSS family